MYDVGALSLPQGDMERALALYDEEDGTSTELQCLAADVMCGAAILLMEQNKWTRAQALADRALALRQQLGNRRDVAQSLSVARRLAYARKRYAKAQELLSESLTVCEDLDDRTGIAIACKHLGSTRYYRRQWEDAAGHLERSLALFEELGDVTWVGYALINLANVHYKINGHAIADTVYLECLAIRWLLDERAGIDACLAALIHNAAASQAYCRAAWIYGVEQQLCHDLGFVRPPQDEEPFQERMHVVRQHLGKGFEVTVKEREKVPLDQALAVLIAGQAVLSSDDTRVCTLKAPHRAFCQVRLDIRDRLKPRERKVADASGEGTAVTRMAAEMRLGQDRVVLCRCRWLVGCMSSCPMGTRRACASIPALPAYGGHRKGDDKGSDPWPLPHCARGACTPSPPQRRGGRR